MSYRFVSINQLLAVLLNCPQVLLRIQPPPLIPSEESGGEEDWRQIDE